MNLRNVYYLPSSPFNLLNLGLLNNNGILHDNENETLYQLGSKRVLAQARRWRNSYLLKLLNLSDAALFFVKIDDKTYKWPPHAFLSSSSSQTSSPITIWHKSLGHTNFASLRRYLKRLEVDYVDDAEVHIYDSCQLAKATKVYNRDPKKRSQQPYQFIHTDLVGPINPVRFSGKRHFFTFTDDCTRYTEIYTGSKKNNWLECLKTFHSLCRTRLKQAHPIETLRSDYGSELQSHKADEWLQKEEIVFEPLAPYSQEQNGVSDRVRRTILDMRRATILKGNIDNELWPEVVLAMTYIKNNRPTKALPSNSTPHKVQSQENTTGVSHLRVLGSTV